MIGKFSLKKYNSFGIEAYCRTFVSVKAEDNISEVLKEIDGQVRVLGGGSNILLTGDIEETVLFNEIKGIKVLQQHKDHVIVEVGGGEVWHAFVMWAVLNGYGGVENLALIPGTVGAAPIQNIGAYGVEQKDVFVSLTAYDLKTGEDEIFDLDDCKFGYRDSIFKQKYKGKYLITSIRYKLSRKHQLQLAYGAIKQQLVEERITDPTIREVCDIVIKIRNSKLPDPRYLGNSGSFFKNPVVRQDKFESIRSIYPDMPFYPADEGIKIPAGWLIEQCGLKGKRIGDTGTYEHQALVIVNHDNATGQEIWNFAQQVMSTVEEKFGIVLIPEVNIW